MTKIVAILNLTPDSFSDGGKFFNHKLALKQTEKMLRDGADIIDVGAESTRPGANPISAIEEWQRLKVILPDICKMAHAADKEISLDSYHFTTVEKAVDLGVNYINDVSGLKDLRLLALAKSYRIKYILMHNLAIHADHKQIIDKDLDPITVVEEWLVMKLEQIKKHGFPQKDIIFDPGIGFAKTNHHSLILLKNIKKFSNLGLDLYVGHSRKSLLQDMFETLTEERDLETALLSSYLVDMGVKYLRVHNVLHNAQALKFSKIFS